MKQPNYWVRIVAQSAAILAIIIPALHWFLGVI